MCGQNNIYVLMERVVFYVIILSYNTELVKILKIICTKCTNKM